MAKTKATKSTKTAAKKDTVKTTALLRKGVLAYVGLHGSAQIPHRSRCLYDIDSNHALLDA